MFFRSGHKQPALALAGAILCLGMCGCGKEQGFKRVAVSGTVNLDGAPLAEGSIEFFPIAPTIGPRSTAQIKDGKFALTKQTGPVAGPHRVEIYVDQHIELEDPDVAAALPGHKLPPNPVDEKFNKKSELTETITDGTTPLKYDVTSRPK
ncbi:MAG: hypothetical protein AB7I37_23955 [Pirellulales bacterium]